MRMYILLHFTDYEADCKAHNKVVHRTYGRWSFAFDNMNEQETGNIKPRVVLLSFLPSSKHKLQDPANIVSV